MSPAVLALARKELRTSWGMPAQLVGFVLLAGIAAPLLGLRDLLERHLHEVALLAGAPLAALLLGGSAVASEEAESTWDFLAARPLGRRTVLLVKLGSSGALALLGWLACVALVRLFAGPAEGAWMHFVEAPARHAAAWGLILTLVLYLLAYAVSVVFPEPLSAALAGLLAACAWVGIVLGVVVKLGGSHEVALALGPWLALPLLSAPAAAVAAAVLGFRADGPSELPSRTLAVSVAALALLPWLALLAMPPLVAHARAAREGQGKVEPSPVLANPPVTAVAFVVTTEVEGDTRRHAAIAFLDRERRFSGLRVLPPGTTPLGWTERGTELIVEWEGGLRRGVGMDGRVHAPTGEPQPARSPAQALAMGGRLLAAPPPPSASEASSTSSLVLYPPPEGVFP